MANTTVTIYRADGSELMTAPVTDGAQLERKLMGKDEMTLSWMSAEAALIPMGAYAACPLNGVRYYMADPYHPQQKDVGLYEYKPAFTHPVFLLDKIPLMLYSRDAAGAVTGAECDWSFTGRGADLFASVEAAIREGLGEDWEIAVDGEFEAALTLTFSNTSVLAALNAVAEAWDAEWWYEDLTGGDGGRRITFGRMCAHGASLPLAAGVEVECPQSNQKNTLYNRFYVFGGTRNIPQDYSGAQANSVVNKRLTLDPARYPQGYIDLPLFDADGNAALDEDGNLVADTSAENAGRRFAKVLQFDDIYPRCGCRVKFGTLHSVQRYVRDTDDQKVLLADGTYDSWRLYAFALEYYDDAAGEWRDFRLDKSTYDKDANPGGSLIKGLSLSLHFKSGALEGREFEAVYHDADKEFRSEDGSEGFTAAAGFFEVVHAEDNTIILPGPGIAPEAASTAEAHDGDEVVVFNIRMPEEYYSTAYAELEAEAIEAIWDEVKDANEYTVKGNKVHFHDSDPGLSVGRLVRLSVGGRAIDTRVTALTTKIGAPYDQSITFCKAISRGKVTTLLTQIEAARRDITEVAVADDAKVRASRQRLYAAQREMVDAMFDTDGYLTAPISPAAVETAVLKTGAASANFQLGGVVFEANYNDGAAGASYPNHFRASAGTLTHYGLGGDEPRAWSMAAADLSDELADDDAPYYLYAKCADGGTAGTPTLTTEQIRFDGRLATEGCYYFLVGVLSSVLVDGNGRYRVLNCTYGSTTVSGRFVKTGRIESVDGSTVIDLDKGVIKGNIQLASSSSDDQNKQFIDSLLGYSSDKQGLEAGIATAQSASADAQDTANSAKSAAASAMTTASAAKDAVDGMEVGGRNYLLGTAKEYALTGKGTSTEYTMYPYTASSTDALLSGRTVTISFDYDNEVTDGSANILVHNTWSLLLTCPSSNCGSGHVSKTLTLTTDVVQSHPIYIQGKWAGSITLRNVKWELGNVPTDWTPAPEDVDDAIAAAKAAAVEEVDVMYALGASPTTAPTGGWQTTAPAWEDGKYMWQRTDITTGDGVTHTGTPTCIQGAAGKDGATGAAGAAGRGVKSVQEQYYLSTSKTAQSGGSWQTSQPTWSAGKYVWTRSLITYTDGATGYSAATLSELFNAANETAAAASTTAAAAQTTANSASSTAAAAQSTANSAQTTANSAQTTANAANTTANSAAATANSAIALTGDPDNLFTDQFLFTLSNTTDVTPPKGKARLCRARDNYFGNEIAVTTGAEVTIEAVMLRHPDDTAGIPPRFGLYYTDKDEGVVAYVDYNLATDMGTVGMTDAWHKWRRVFTVPSGVYKGKFFLQIDKAITDSDGNQVWNVIKNGAFYVSSVVVKMETRDYLREALEEAAAGTTDVSGGLVLSSMMSVRDAGGVMVAGMSGAAAAAQTGALPMIWAGATENTTEGIGAAAFRVFNSGHVDMGDVAIAQVGNGGLGLTIRNASLVMGVISDGQISSPLTEIVPQKYSNIAAALASRNTGSSSGASATYNMTPSLAGDGYVWTGSHKKDIVTIPLSYAAGTLTLTVTAASVAVSTSLSGDVKGLLDASALASGETVYNYFGMGNAEVTVTLWVTVNGAKTVTLLSASDASIDLSTTGSSSTKFKSVSASASGSISATTTKTLNFAPGDKIGLLCEVSTKVVKNAGAVTGLEFSKSCSASVTCSYKTVSQNYNNIYFANGMLLSSSTDKYVAASSAASDGEVFRMRSGSALLRFNAGGLMQSTDGSAWWRANPLALIIKLTSGTATNPSTNVLYNPFGKNVSCVRSSTGKYVVTHNLGNTSHTVLANGKSSEGSNMLYASVYSIGTDADEIRTADDSSLNDFNTLYLHFLVYA